MNQFKIGNRVIEQFSNMNKNIINNLQIKTLKPISWEGRNEHEMWKIKRQIIYSKSTRTLYPKIKFRYGCNK